MNTSPTTLVFGKDGQLGRAFQEVLANKDRTIFVGREECDLSQAQNIQEILEKYQPSIIFNASAYTAVDAAEKEPELAHLVNSEAPRVMAQYIRQINNGVLVHYSTDYVFDGLKKTPYKEDDPSGPLSQYGKSKLSGEKVIQKVFSLQENTHHAKYFILRTSWVYGDGGNFIRTMLKLAKEREQLKVISDQFGVPTSALWLAQMTLKILEKGIPSGIYHAVPEGETSWYGLAQYAIEQAVQMGLDVKVKPEAILPIPATEYPLPAPRPYNSRMNHQKLQTALQEDFPPWQPQVSEYIKSYLGQSFH